jgi:XTP/dITP diphosphohydrolase
VLLRDPSQHPSAIHLERAGLTVEPIPDGSLHLRDRRDLIGLGDPGDRRLAAGLCDAAESGTEQVVLLGADDVSLGRAVALEGAKRRIEIEFMFLAEMPAGGELLRLVEVERALRDPENGCPWDLEQTHASLAKYLVEETYETLDAIAGGQDEDIVEELGDVLLQVVFHAQLGADRRAFTIDDVARGISDKLVRRHPHVFGDTDVEDADEVASRWDEIKAAEKPERSGPFDGVASSQPAMPFADKIVSRAAKAHAPVQDAAAAGATIRTQLESLAAGVDAEDGQDAAAQVESQIGELLLAAVALSRSLDVDPELSLRAAAQRLRLRVEGYVGLAAQREIELATAADAVRSALLDECRERYG